MASFRLVVRKGSSGPGGCVGDDAGRDVAKLDVAGLGGTHQEAERAVGIECVAFHQDADRLTDSGAGGLSWLQLEPTGAVALTPEVTHTTEACGVGLV